MTTRPPEAVRAWPHSGGLLLRRFGTVGNDLEVDFTTAPPLVVTDVLSRCCVGPGRGPDDFWGLTVARRIEAVLVLAELHSLAPLSVPLRCPRPECVRPMELDLTPAEVLAYARGLPQDAECIVRLGVGTVTLRRPTGADQRSWLGQSFGGPDDARRVMLRTLLVGAVTVELTPPRVAAIESALADFDPLVAFRPTAVCPHCGEGGEHDVDLAAFALARLRTAQVHLLHAVHRLASRYHWSEPEVLALPAWRRGHYLALLDREEAVR